VENKLGNWTTKRIEGLKVYLNDFLRLIAEHDGIGRASLYHCGSAQMSFSLQVETAGFISGDISVEQGEIVCNISEIKIHGGSAASGPFYYKVLLPALRKSSGRLEAILIWVQGDGFAVDWVVDSAVRLVVNNGDVQETRVA
jgi:hypothetical protein